MKGSNSRFSHRPGERYSNLGQVQGGMVTDADLTEAGQLHQARGETLGTLAIRSGVPVRDGMVDLTGGAPALRAGLVMAEGKVGRFVPDRAPTSNPLSAFTRQTDLPAGPALPEGGALVYVDLWERPVFSLQDSYLSDPGLHGAETSWRTRTMVQIKAHPLADAADADELAALLADLESPGEHSPFARTGTATAVVQAKQAEIALDDCDPCADQVSFEQQVPNALFRLEVIAVTRQADGSPETVRFAWSHENASAIDTAATLGTEDGRAAFARDGMVYEFFSDTTEAHVGWFPAGFAPERPTLKEDPEPPSGGSFTHARRWDGYGMLNVATETLSDQAGTGRMTLVGGATKRARLTLETFTLTLDVVGRTFLAGDHWLVELRRFAAEAERLRLVGADASGRALPVGIRHHIAPLFRIAGGAPVALSDPERRRLSFPALSDLPASHVSYDPECPDLFQNAETVQEALDALCHLDATHVAFDPGPECERFEGAETVHDALRRLCRIEDSTNIERILRHLMDWGVVCGLRVAQAEPGSSKVRITRGAMLDRAGRFIDVPDLEVDLNDLPDRNVPVPLPEILQREEELCLALAAEPGEERRIGVHLVPRRLAFGPVDRTFAEAVDACLEGRQKVNFGDRWVALADSDRRVAEDMVAVWKNRDSLFGTVPLKSEQRNVALAFNQTLFDDFAEKANEDEVERVRTFWAAAEREYDPGNTRGTTRERRLMQLEAAKLGILANSDEERQRRCRCENALPPCPPAQGETPLYVPIACIENWQPQGPRRFAFIRMVCELCCRKQAVSWRSFLFYNVDPVRFSIRSLTSAGGANADDRFLRLQKECCVVRAEPPRGGLGDWLKDWDDLLYPPIEPKPMPDPFPPLVPRWPLPQPPYDILPEIGPGIVLPGGGFTDPVPGFKFKVDLVDLTVDNAVDQLTGNGFEVVSQIDLDDADDPLGIVREASGETGRLLTDVLPEPGDKVAMLTQNGRAAGYVVVSKGTGKTPYIPQSERLQTAEQIEQVVIRLRDDGVLTPSTRVGRETLPDLGAFEARLGALTDLKDRAEAELTRTRGELDTLSTDRTRLGDEIAGLRRDIGELTSTRETLARDVQGARSELNQVAADRASLTAEIGALSSQLQELRTAREGTLAGVAEARGQLNELATLRTAIVRDVEAARVEAERIRTDVGRPRAELAPVESIVTEPAVAAVLREQGVTTVGALANLTPEQETAILRNRSINRATLNDFVARSRRDLNR
jgi:hypothetical protein